MLSSPHRFIISRRVKKGIMLSSLPLQNSLMGGNIFTLAFLYYEGKKRFSGTSNWIPGSEAVGI
jgi:hypothetical protein